MLDLVLGLLHNLRAITVNEFLGNTGDESLWVLSRSAVNISGLAVGAAHENGFPPDVSPVFSDLFTLILAHELNHVVNAYGVERNQVLKLRQPALIKQAGEDNENYLRSMFRDGLFKEAPQEFFASISNQWFADSAHTLLLGFTRFQKGFAEPLNQAFFMAEVYSLGGSSTFLYNLDTQGTLVRTEVPIERDAEGRIVAVSVGSIIYRFQLDASGNVVSATEEP